MYPIGIPVWVVMHSLAANSTAARVFALVAALISGIRMTQWPLSWLMLISKHWPATGPRTLWERTRRSGRAEKLQVLWFVRIFCSSERLWTV